MTQNFHMAVCGMLELPDTLRDLRAKGRPAGNLITVRSHPRHSRLSPFANQFAPISVFSDTGFRLTAFGTSSPFGSVARDKMVLPALRLLVPCTDVVDPNHQKAPNTALLKQIVAFADFHAAMKPDKTLLVQCAFGLSRSPSVALLITAALSGSSSDPAACVDHVLNMRPRATFNPLIVKIIDDYLGFGGRLSETVEAHPSVARNNLNMQGTKKVHDLIQRYVR